MSENSKAIERDVVVATKLGASDETLMEVLEMLRNVLPPVLTREQLVGLGRENLLHARGVLKGRLAKARTIRKKQQQMLKLVDRKTVAKVQKIAAQSDDPQYKSCKSKWRGEKVMPSNPEAKTRIAGSTTLNVCGWCKYAVPYMIPHGRTVIPDEQRVFRPSCRFCHDEWKSEFEHDFNTPCILKESQEGLEEISGQLRKRHNEYMEYYDKLVQYIRFLDELIAEAESKPILPQYRSLRHYAEGTLVYFINRDSCSGREWPPYPFDYEMVRPNYDVWQGKVVGHVEYEYVEGAVSILIEGREKPTTFTYTDERLISYEELACLANDLDYARIWMAGSKYLNFFLLDALLHYQKNRYLEMKVR